MSSNCRLESISVGQIKVKPFSNIEHVLSQIFSENRVIPGIAIAINPEKVLTCENDIQARNSVLNATIPYADGIGVVKVLERKTGQKLARIAGVDLWQAVMKKAGLEQSRVFLIGSTDETLIKCRNKLQQRYQVNVVGSESGYFSDYEALIANIKATKPDIITIAMGSPKQELLIEKLKSRGISAFYMGVGGTYDVFVGKVKRAPKVWRLWHLEWLYRLLRQPTRIKRQFKLLNFFFRYLKNDL